MDNKQTYSLENENGVVLERWLCTEAEAVRQAKALNAKRAGLAVAINTTAKFIGWVHGNGIYVPKRGKGVMNRIGPKMLRAVQYVLRRGGELVPNREVCHYVNPLSDPTLNERYGYDVVARCKRVGLLRYTPGIHGGTLSVTGNIEEMIEANQVNGLERYLHATLNK